MFSVIYSEKATKSLQQLDRPTAARIYGWIDKNLDGCDNPRIHGKTLDRDLNGYWRYRFGDYKLIAYIHDEPLRIEIIRAGRRREVYE
ncbi:MAG: type II toxin-antitoxin system RelE/ParE family toxin [Clostridiales bacterium]|nr:type II toxin-antitoxin system RelE/ParE family toxin [Clostridiales bacterium]